MLYADTELSDFVCNENERFRFHLDVLSPFRGLGRPPAQPKGEWM